MDPEFESLTFGCLSHLIPARFLLKFFVLFADLFIMLVLLMARTFVASTGNTLKRSALGSIIAELVLI